MSEAALNPSNFPLAQTAESDERLISRAQEGDEAAFGELAERYSTRLRRTLYRITRDCDAAYDAVQEALIRAWKNIARFEGRSRFYTWLTRIGINEAYRAIPRHPEEPLEVDDLVGQHVPDWGSQPDRVFESREFLGAIFPGYLKELKHAATGLPGGRHPPRRGGSEHRGGRRGPGHRGARPEEPAAPRADGAPR